MKAIVTGDLLLFQPGDPYELIIDANEDGKVASGDYFMFCRGDWFKDWWERYDKVQCYQMDLDERVLALWRQIILEKRKFEEENRELTDYLLRAFCLQIDRVVRDSSTFHSGGSYTVTRMKRFIEEHATQTFKVADVARHVRLSVSRAVHLYKQSSGKTMIQYALEIRLSIAVERMKYSNLTLEQIAESCGFASYQYFHRVFTRRYGIPPKMYRDNERTV